MSRWEPISDALYATENQRCDLCGKMMVKRLWRVEHEGRAYKFCDGECERFWHEYWLPRYGGKADLTSPAIGPPGG